MNMNTGSQSDYSSDQFKSDIKMVVAHIIDALRQNKQEEDYQVELTIFSSENREEHEGPSAVVRMPNGLPPDKAAWPMALGFIGKQYGSSGSPKPAAACLVTHAYYREVPIQKPESTPLPEDLDMAGLAASVCDWLNSGMTEVNDTAVDDEKKAQENYKASATDYIDGLTAEEYDALPRVEVIMVQAATFDGREGTAIIHFTRDIDNCIVPEDIDDVQIGELETRNEDWGDGLLFSFFKGAAGSKSNGFKASIDPFR